MWLTKYILILCYTIVFSNTVTNGDEANQSLRSASSNNDIIEASGFKFSKANEADSPPRLRMQQINDFYHNRKMLEGINTVSPAKVTWSDVVIYILTFNSKQPNRLLKAQFDTWIKLVDDEGLDIVVVTDDDDERPFEEILPDADKVKPTIHLYKSPAKKEGTLTRAKVVDTMSYIYDNFIKNRENPKKYYLKVDCDTIVIPENLMLHLQKLDDIVSDLPADFGKANCFTKEQDICYTAGGFYGMNRIGFEAAYRYILGHPSMYDQHIESFLNGDNLMNHEDFFISYAFRQATGYPAINVLEMGEKIYGRHQIGVHKAKPVQIYYKVYETLFDEDGNLRDTVLTS